MTEQTPVEADGQSLPPFGVRREQVGHDAAVVVTLEYPTFMPPADHEQQQAVAVELNAEIRTVMSARIASFEQHNTASQQNVASGLPRFSLHIRCEATAKGPALVSMACSEHSYTGGAHGNHLTRGYTFSIRRGHLKRLDLDDLLQKPRLARAKLDALCVADLRRQEAESIVSGEVERLDDLLEHFAVSEDGLLIFFAPYAVAPYASGEYTVVLPWKQLEPLLRRTPPIREMLPRAE